MKGVSRFRFFFSVENNTVVVRAQAVTSGIQTR